MIIGHRGAGHLSSENTITSIHKAIELGIQGVEVDVHCTLDDIIILSHDECVGERVSIRYSDYGNILRVKPTVPTLEEILRLVKNSNLTIFIELKSSNASKDYTRRLVSETIKIIKESKIDNRVVLLSFEKNTLEQAHRICPEIPLCYNAYNGDFTQVPTFCEYWAPIYTTITNEVVICTHHHNKKILTWTPNLKEEITYLIDLGVEGIITDQPLSF